MKNTLEREVMHKILLFESILSYICGCCLDFNINESSPYADIQHYIALALCLIGIVLLVIFFHKYYALTDDDDDDV